jgi:hypothetical protein
MASNRIWFRWRASQKAGNSDNCEHVGFLPGQPKEAIMPALLIPVLVGIPVLFVGGYYIIQAMH